MLKIHYATNRNILSDAEEPPEFGKRFHVDGSMFFRIGKAVAERDGDAYRFVSATMKWEKLRESSEDKEETLGSEAIFEELQDKMVADRRDIIVLIHGFAASFETTIERAAELKDKYLIQGEDGELYMPHVFAFSWPSDGKVFPYTKYHSDREDAAASGIAIARSLLKLIDFLRRGAETPRIAEEDGKHRSYDRMCQQNIHLVAHSMGNWALRHAVQGLRVELGTDRLPRIFDNVFLMAADEDDDALERDDKLGLLPRLARAIHIYHSRGDLALEVSDRTKGNPDRLGSNGPRTKDGLSAKIFTIDCRKVDFTTIGHGNHQYYRLREEVIHDVRQVLAGVPADLIDGRRFAQGERCYLLG